MALVSSQSIMRDRERWRDRDVVGAPRFPSIIQAKINQIPRDSPKHSEEMPFLSPSEYNYDHQQQSICFGQNPRLQLHPFTATGSTLLREE